MDQTARQIQRRINWIILRALIGVVLLTLLLTIISIGITISTNFNEPFLSQFSSIARLEGYYQGRGTWQGVESVFQGNSLFFGNHPTLLDARGRVVLDHGNEAAANVGTLYQFREREIVIDLQGNGRVIGKLVFDRFSTTSRLGVVALYLLPATGASLLMALLAIQVITMLSRRIIRPLAEVIAAARQVTAGNLDARVQVRGPQDLYVLAESFNQMAATLERNDRERRDLLADIAHELRTPISVIRGRLEGILDGVYPADEEHISLALKANYLLERLVEDLRILTLAESGQIPFEKKEINLATLASHVIEIFNAEAQEKSIHLSMEPVSGDPLVLADPQRTEQVVGNLVSNALRYTPEGGRVWIVTEKTADRVVLSVYDNGPGVPDEDLPYIFNRFWRKEKSRARLSGGSGLGLAIARQFVEAQGGTIIARNDPSGAFCVAIAFALAGTRSQR